MTETEEKNEAYRQRNYLVAALARLFPSGITRTAIPDWDPEWHGCCFIDLPSGQISYHYHDREAHLFADLPPYEKPWDGHDKDTVHRRLMSLTRGTIFDNPKVDVAAGSHSTYFEAYKRAAALNDAIARSVPVES